MTESGVQAPNTGAVSLGSPTGRAWRGVIAEYRDRLPVDENTPVVTLCEGGTPLLPAPVLSARTGCDVYLKVEGRQPDRFVQGPWHDRGHQRRGGRGRPGGDLRVHRQHQRQRRRLRRARRYDLRRARPAGQDRASASWPRRWSTGPSCSR